MESVTHITMSELSPYEEMEPMESDKLRARDLINLQSDSPDPPNRRVAQSFKNNQLSLQDRNNTS